MLPGRREAWGLALAAVGWLAATGVHTLLPSVPALTVAFVLGLLGAQVFGSSPAGRAVRWEQAAPGLAFAGKRLMRAGIVLLGFAVSLTDIASVGLLAVLATLALVPVAFGVTWLAGRGMDDDERLLLAAGFSICGASAIAAAAAARRIDTAKTAVPTALVTLCGSLAIALMPALVAVTGATGVQAGAWIGASVHDVGQVVAAAQSSAPVADGAAGVVLTVAVAVKMVRVLCLAPVTAVLARSARRQGASAGQTAPSGGSIAGGASPSTGTTAAGGQAGAAAAAPLVPLFVAGFVVALVVRTWVPLPHGLLGVVGALREALLCMALVGLGAAVRPVELWRRGRSSLRAALLSWGVLVAAGAVVALVAGR
ncbi:YeiH family protein [Falsarthrobacter nasiphocae]|uniref:Integral membrane protein (TIGR00698 family) n=1 Tax=Falsarthrobacter nasiphocae TaxID=189863 RepID=A0AAE4C491_9MICC|nr:putative sulfate exporter family transporter [Falsarthrobacter nasiphocae]MDR6891126.1 putative integral membrane protein (TIGR00698 family) [Falsarthrobacter nasiphocae]